MKETNFSSRQDFWKALVRGMQSSSLSQDEFAKANGVSKSSLVRWAKKLSVSAAAAPMRTAVPKLKNFLVIESDESVRSRIEPVKIVFPSGHTIHLMERPEPEWLSLMMKLIA